MPLIGTAGHVDHGKSTLVQRLTGRDPDRWDEEKRRGLTIDLGFAWATLPSGVEVSFVDVPGHERYLKNMLAGIEAIDIALLVVAADEGWMPQSEEHLAVLDLLEVTNGVVALTKVDAVDPDLAELAEIETTERLEGTSLEGIEVVPVSAVTGEGIGELTDRLDQLAEQASVSDRGRPRLWVDRVFSASGAGTVVTGTLLDGNVAVEETVRLYPGNGGVRIRGIQSHEQALDTVGPGRRVALNLSAIDRAEVSRGVMVGGEDDWLMSDRFLATIQPARYVEGIDKKGAYQLHIGTAIRQVRVIGLSERAAVMSVDSPLPMEHGDRYILRDTGRKLVVAGGSILDPIPGPTSEALQNAEALISAPDRQGVADALLEIHGYLAVEDLRKASGGEDPATGETLGRLTYSSDRLSDLRSRATELVRDEHIQHPLRVGIPLATLAGEIGLDPPAAERLLDGVEELERVGPDVRVKGRSVELDSESTARWSRARDLLAESLTVPSLSDLDLDAELTHVLVRQGDLVRISDDLAFLPEQMESLKQVLSRLDSDFTVAEFRDASGLSRKYAVPFLEWSDKEGLTVRRGDLRRVR